MRETVTVPRLTTDAPGSRAPDARAVDARADDVPAGDDRAGWSGQPDRVDVGTVRAVVGLAARAPSVHNTQPWRCVLLGATLHLHADRARWLRRTDPDGRDLVISCGALLQHLEVGFAAAGVQTRVHRLPNPADPDHLAALELRPGRTDPVAVRRAALVERRRSDRRPYADVPLPEAVRRRLFAVAARQGVLLRLADAALVRERLVPLLRDASREQEDDAGYRHELALWTGRHGGPDGVGTGSLLEPTGGPWDLDRAFGDGEVAVPVGTAPDGATLAVLATSSDDRLSQLRAGEALAAVLLEATALDLAACPLSQPVEVARTRLRLRDDLLDGRSTPQVLLRLGRRQTGVPLPPTPRRAVDDVLRVGGSGR